MKQKTRFRLLSLLLLTAIPHISHAGLEEVTVMALGPVDGRAVIKTDDGKMQVLKVGDRVQGTQAMVKKIFADRLVVTEFIEGDPPVAQEVWLYKSGKPGEKSRIQRLDRTGPPKQMTRLKVIKSIKPSNKNTALKNK